jgi:septum formation protein
MKLILASASPRRKDLLAALGVPFEVVPSRADEGSAAEVSPGDATAVAVSLARMKARDVASASGPHEPALVVGADTLVVLPDRVLGKPSSREEARAMLRALAGREHRVVTGVAAVDPASGKTAEGSEETRVFFRELDEATIEAYLATGEPSDKAGAYAVQGVGSLLVERIEGCYFNVVGLPLGRLAEVLGRLGYNLLAEAAASAAGDDGGGTRRDSGGPAQ